MKNKIKPSQLLSTVNVPVQELSKLSFCSNSKVSGVKEWVDSLQATKVLHTSGQLYSALPEIARLKTDFQNRFEILETLRPSVQYSILGLQKSFLNQPLIMPAEAQKSVVVAQSLQKYMIDAYIVTIMQIAQKGRANKSTFDLLAKAIHRAISGIGLLFFRNYQIYSHPPANLWATLNVLYLVADYYDLASKSVIDPNLKNTRAMTIEAAYTRVLMMDIAKTNQMSQSEIELAYTTFENWCQTVNLHQGLSEDPENFYVVNLLSSQGPLYKSKIADKSTGQFVEIGLKSLLSQLSKQSSSAGDEAVSNRSTGEVPKEFPPSLLNHLIDTWSSVAQRKHDRRSSDTTAEVCVGLTECHYFVCNGQEFDYFLSSTDSHEPQKISRFSQGLTPASHLDESHESRDVPVHKVLAQNSSAGGYCLMWQGKISAKVSAGEILGIKETGKRTWSIGVIRWVRQLKNASQIGIQLLANNPKPYGLAQNYDTGGYSEYMRAFFLPPTKFAQSNPTLLCSSAPFQEFDKVRVLDGERKWSAKLDRCIFSTKSVQQFSFRNTDSGEPANAPSDADSNFDSKWD